MSVGKGAPQSNVCVLDTSSLKQMARVEMAGKSLLEHTRQTFKIVLPKEVENEVRRNFARGISGMEKAHAALKTLDSKINDVETSHIEYIDDWVDRHHTELNFSKRHFDSGEKHCGALAIQKSIHEREGLVLTLTDDKSCETRSMNSFVGTLLVWQHQRQS